MGQSFSKTAAGSTWPCTSCDVKDIRFDLDLRKKMPPLMAQFALRLDDGHTFRARGDLEIGWTGEHGEPAWCKWKNMLVVFDGNSVKTGIPLEHIQGQLDQCERLVQRRVARG